MLFGKDIISKKLCGQERRFIEGSYHAVRVNILSELSRSSKENYLAIYSEYAGHAYVLPPRSDGVGEVGEVIREYYTRSLQGGLQ